MQIEMAIDDGNGCQHDGSAALAGFGQGTLPDIYLLQVKTGSVILDDALYSLAHPTAPDATPGATHLDVLRALNMIVEDTPVYSVIASKLAKAYAEEHGLN